MKKISYKAEDYTYRITKNLEPNPNTGYVDYRVHFIEFDVDYFFDKLGDITENKIFEIIKGLMKTRAHFQKMALPIPLKYS